MMYKEEFGENVILPELYSPEDDGDYISIEDYVLKILGMEKTYIEKPEIFYKNFIHLMCHLYRDIKEIEDRLADYRIRYKSLGKAKSNKAVYERRKILYFCKLNKDALEEINSFVADGIPDFLYDRCYDTLKKECECGDQANYSYRSRYRYAWHRDYYSMDYPFGIIVKVSWYVREKYNASQYLEEEKRLLSLYSNSPNQFWDQIDQYVENDHVMANILERISDDYNLCKRKEIFETLNRLFHEAKYQSFIALGLIQIEGLFDDYCQLRFGESENQGTLVDKALKSLGTNEYNLLRMYPYFAFDVPLIRNEVAHKGMLSTEDAKRIAYDLVLDLNTLSQMVDSESMDKFVCVIMAHEKLLEWDSKADGNTDELYDTLLYELLMFDKIANAHFWKVLREPESYREEIEFYRKDDLSDGMIDLPGIIEILFRLVRSEAFWAAMHRLVNKYITDTYKWEEVEEFARRMKNEYIAVLDGNAKKECIEVSKVVN